MKQFLLWLFLALVLVSCARVGSPIGGGKDTIPPKMVGSNIDTTRINVPRDLKELKIDFDEYITLKDINKNLIISPPNFRHPKLPRQQSSILWSFLYIFS